MKHAIGYPTYDYLKSIVKTGLPVYGMNGVGQGKNSEGSEGYHFATWTGISGDTFHGRFSGANREVNMKPQT